MAYSTHWKSVIKTGIIYQMTGLFFSTNLRIRPKLRILQSMNTVLEIEDAVVQLPDPDFQTFAAWFDEVRTRRVDGAFENAIIGGQFDEMAARALRDHQAGRTIALDEFLRRA
jgi:hypothetical protein